jgi:hypothetical protein
MQFQYVSAQERQLQASQQLTAEIEDVQERLVVCNNDIQQIRNAHEDVGSLRAQIARMRENVLAQQAAERDGLLALYQNTAENQRLHAQMEQLATAKLILQRVVQCQKDFQEARLLICKQKQILATFNDGIVECNVRSEKGLDAAQRLYQELVQTKNVRNIVQYLHNAENNVIPALRQQGVITGDLEIMLYGLKKDLLEEIFLPVIDVWVGLLR